MSLPSSLKWSRYIPEERRPFATQLAFLLLEQKEALFGGGCGGGKSDCLLMAALQWVDVPGYAALIVRKSITDLNQPGALLFRAQDWLRPWMSSGHVRYDKQNRIFFFKDGGTLTFGYLGEYRAEERYQGAEYHFVGFDELTQHYEADYLWLHHRCRRNRCSLHDKHTPDCPICQQNQLTRHIPLRTRGTANPGGFGHAWVKKHFGIVRGPHGFIGTNPQAPFIPSLLTDNLYLDQEEYKHTLEQLDPLRRAQLLRGDWEVNETGRFKPEHTKHYHFVGEHICLGDRVFDKSRIGIFSVVDPAASRRDGIGGAVFRNNRDASWSVIGTFGYTDEGDLLILDIDRFQREAPDIIRAMKNVSVRWAPAIFRIEQNGPGIVVAQLASRLGFPVKQAVTIADKVANSVVAQNYHEAGRIWLPQHAPWLEAFNEEFYNWTGHDSETNDQIDVVSNACHEVVSRAGTRGLFGTGILHSPTRTPGSCLPFAC